MDRQASRLPIRRTAIPRSAQHDPTRIPKALGDCFATLAITILRLQQLKSYAFAIVQYDSLG